MSNFEAETGVPNMTPPKTPVVLAFAVLVLTVTTFAFRSSGGDDDPESAVDANSPLVPLVALLGDVEDDAVRRDVLIGMNEALKGRRRLGVPAGWTDVYPDLMRSDDAEVREYAVRLAIVFGDRTAMQSLRTRAAEVTAPRAERVRAIEALSGVSDPRLLPVLITLLEDDTIRGPVVRALAGYEDARIPKLLLARYGRLAPAVKRDAIATLSSRKPWARQLLEAVGEGTVPSGDLSAFNARHLADLGDEGITQLLTEVWGDVRPTSKDRERQLKDLARELDDDTIAEGDLHAGRLVFRKTCANCHRLFDDGRKVGPDLTGSQRFNTEYVLQNLVDPSALVGRDYRVTTLITVSGRIVSGLVAEETDNAIVMRTATEDLTVPAAEIEVRKESGVSMMPEGMLTKMTPTERRDLLAYLRTSQQVPLPE